MSSERQSIHYSATIPISKWLAWVHPKSPGTSGSVATIELPIHLFIEHLKGQFSQCKKHLLIPLYSVVSNIILLYFMFKFWIKTNSFLCHMNCYRTLRLNFYTQIFHFQRQLYYVIHIKLVILRITRFYDRLLNLIPW